MSILIGFIIAIAIVGVCYYFYKNYSSDPPNEV